MKQIITSGIFTIIAVNKASEGQPSNTVMAVL